MVSIPSKICPLDDPLKLAVEKGQTKQGQVNKKLIPAPRCFLGQKLPNAQDIVSRCIANVKQQEVVLPQLMSCTLTKANMARFLCRHAD